MRLTSRKKKFRGAAKSEGAGAKLVQTSSDPHQVMLNNMKTIKDGACLYLVILIHKTQD